MAVRDPSPMNCSTFRFRAKVEGAVARKVFVATDALVAPSVSVELRKQKESACPSLTPGGCMSDRIFRFYNAIILLGFIL